MDGRDFAGAQAPSWRAVMKNKSPAQDVFGAMARRAWMESASRMWSCSLHGKSFGMDADIAVFNITAWPENDVAFNCGQTGVG